MEKEEIFEKGIGTEEKSMLKPAKVKIVSINIKEKTKDGEEMKTPLLELMCKHPDKDDLIAFTKVRLERGSELKVVTTWLQIDSEGNIQKSSTLASLMNFLGAKKLNELYGKEVEAIEESQGSKFLCLKAY